jgi:hypothetical protein
VRQLFLHKSDERVSQKRRVAGLGEHPSFCRALHSKSPSKKVKKLLPCSVDRFVGVAQFARPGPSPRLAAHAPTSAPAPHRRLPVASIASRLRRNEESIPTGGGGGKEYNPQQNRQSKSGGCYSSRLQQGHSRRPTPSSRWWTRGGPRWRRRARARRGRRRAVCVRNAPPTVEGREG